MPAPSPQGRRRTLYREYSCGLLVGRSSSTCTSHVPNTWCAVRQAAHSRVYKQHQLFHTSTWYLSIPCNHTTSVGTILFPSCGMIPFAIMICQNLNNALITIDSYQYVRSLQQYDTRGKSTAPTFRRHGNTIILQVRVEHCLHLSYDTIILQSV